MSALRLPRLLSQQADWTYYQIMEDESGCPYYQGKGICSSGCHSEPSCQTSEPLEGWPLTRPGRSHQPKASLDAVLDRVNEYAYRASARESRGCGFSATNLPRVTLRGARLDHLARIRNANRRSYAASFAPGPNGEPF